MDNVRSGKIILKKRSLIIGTLVLFIVLQVVIATIGALNQFDREFWHDSIKHNRICIEAESFKDLRREVGYQSQPLLDYVLRFYIYLPVLGTTERALRLPDLIFYILTLIACTVFSYIWLKDMGIRKKTVALAGAFLSLLYIANIPALSFYASEGRHYSWCVFISIIWVFFAIKKESLPNYAFHGLSFLYLNSHFFVWPLVATFYAYNMVSLWRNNKKREALNALLWGVGIFSISTLLNYNGILYMINSLGGTQSSQTTTIKGTLIFPCIKKFGEILYSYLNTLNLVYIILPIITFLAANREKRLSIGIGSTLLTFAFLAISTDYMVSKRYFLPLTGIAWAAFLYLLGLIITNFHKERTQNIKKNSLKMLLLALSTILISLTLLEPLFKRPSPAQLLDGVKFPNENFTSMWKFFEELKTSKKKTIIISLSEWETETLMFYKNKIKDEAPFISVYEVGKGTQTINKILKKRDVNSKDINIFLYTWDTCAWNYYNGNSKTKPTVKRVYCTGDYINRCIYKIEGHESSLELGPIIRELKDVQGDNPIRQKVGLTY